MSRRTPALLPVWVLALLLLVAAPAAARSQPEDSPPEESAPSQTQKQSGEGEKKPPERVEAGFEMRWRAEFRDNADQQPADDFDAFLGQRLRVHLLFRIHPHLTAYVQGQDVWLFGAESDKVIHNLGTNLHQAYLDWKPSGSSHWELRAGRQELIYGEERLVGAFGWDNVGRSFDSARLRYRAGAWRGDFFWARLVDVRRAGLPHRPGNQDLYGGYFIHAKRDSPGRTELYALYLRDGLRTVGERPLDDPQATRIATLGFRRLYEPARGWRYSLEHAWQFGQRGPDRHRAAMLIAKGGYLWKTRWQPRLQIEYDFATGDNNATDGNAREFNNLFPTNHGFYGYADLFGLRNLHDWRLTAGVKPHAKLVLEADYHRFLLAARRGPWKNAGGRVLGFDPTGEAGRDVGQELDLTARVPVNTHLSFLGGYSVFFPGRFAVRTRGPETHHFGYIQTTVRF